MMKNNDTQSLVEVWEWKEKVYNKIKNEKGNLNYWENDAEKVILRLGLQKVSAVKSKLS